MALCAGRRSYKVQPTSDLGRPHFRRGPNTKRCACGSCRKAPTATQFSPIQDSKSIAVGSMDRQIQHLCRNF